MGIDDNFSTDEFHEVILKDEAGNDVHFDHVLTFKYEGEKYIALLPLDEVEGIGEDEVLLLRIDNQNGEDVYKTIENEVLLEEVFDEFMRLLEELDADDENENGDEI
ncbi:MAG TPA: DUF1292 domain-containing protein [Clostridiales bacterium]|jgi:uncharacterized protein YrzB (UPF0473 family)|nr:DUF1292 domain-containing protein [Clostridiales bacterium]